MNTANIWIINVHCGNIFIQESTEHNVITESSGTILNINFFMVFLCFFLFFNVFLYEFCPINIVFQSFTQLNSSAFLLSCNLEIDKIDMKYN